MRPRTSTPLTYTLTVAKHETGTVTKQTTGAVSTHETGPVTKQTTGAVFKHETGTVTKQTIGAVSRHETGTVTKQTTGAVSRHETGTVTKQTTGALQFMAAFALRGGGCYTSANISHSVVPWEAGGASPNQHTSDLYYNCVQA